MATLLPDKTTAEEKEQPIQRELDASVLLLGYLQFFEPTDEKFIKTVEVRSTGIIGLAISRSGLFVNLETAPKHVHRYVFQVQFASVL